MEILPSSAHEMMSDYVADTKVVAIDPDGKKRFRIKKLDPLEQSILQILSVPDFDEESLGKDKGKLLNAAKDYMNDKKNRPVLMKAALLNCVVEPKIVEGEPPKTDGKYTAISYDAMDPEDRMRLLAQIFDFSGFSDNKRQFFRTPAGASGTGPGPGGEPLQGPPEPALTDAHRPAGG